MHKIVYPLLVVLLCVSCSSETAIPNLAPEETLYFPPQTANDRKAKSIADLGWKPSAVQPLLDYLSARGFITLVNGRIVMENYFNGHSASSV